ncbi:hypothetical protein OGY18_04695, partial [Citrobacter sp. Cpo142]|nr:hypothetical protein [Citrobacter sp. Cpo142]
KSAQIREILISESAWEEMTCLFAPSLDEEIIFTLPKIGFKAEAHVVIIPFDEFMAARTARQVAAPVETPPPPTTAKKNILKCNFLQRYILIPLLGSIFLLFFILYSHQHKNSFYANYIDIGKLHGCQVYSSWSGKEKSTQVFNQFYVKQNLTCPPAKTVYMTLNNSQSGTSILVCREKINSPLAKCKSLFFMEKYDD